MHVYERSTQFEHSRVRKVKAASRKERVEEAFALMVRVTTEKYVRSPAMFSGKPPLEWVDQFNTRISTEVDTTEGRIPSQ